MLNRLREQLDLLATDTKDPYAEIMRGLAGPRDASRLGDPLRRMILAVPDMVSWLAPGGALAVVLQLPSPVSAPVSATPYPSLEALAPIMSLVPPAELDRIATSCGLGREREWQVPLPRSKALHVALYRLNPHISPPAYCGGRSARHGGASRAAPPATCR